MKVVGEMLNLTKMKQTKLVKKN